MSGIQKNNPQIEAVDFSTGYIIKPNSDGTINDRKLAHAMAERKLLYCVSENVNLAASGTQLPMLLIRNPNGSGKTVRLTDLSAIMTNTVGAIAIIRLYYGPTITLNGTAATIRNRAIGGSGAASVLNVYTLPTIAVNGNRLYSGTILAGTGGGTDLSKPFDGSITLFPNNDLLITGQPDGTNRAVEMTLEWAEDA